MCKKFLDFYLGMCLNFNSAMLLIFILRYTITIMRKIGLASTLPLDHNVYLHKFTGVLIFIQVCILSNTLKLLLKFQHNNRNMLGDHSNMTEFIKHNHIQMQSHKQYFNSRCIRYIVGSLSIPIVALC